MLLTRTINSSAGKARSNGVAKPQLTSLVDMLTILLVFLLKSFSVEGNLVSASEDLSLPESNSQESPTPMINVEITTTSVNIDGTLVVNLAEVAGQDSLMISPLYDGLRIIATNTGIDDQQNEVTIQCDRSLDFQIVKKVMYTCAQASFADFSLLVTQEE